MPDTLVDPAVAVRPFTVAFPDAALEDLRRRIAGTQWPEKETVADHSQGVPLAVLQDLAHHRATTDDWRACEARLNALAEELWVAFRSVR